MSSSSVRGSTAELISSEWLMCRRKCSFSAEYALRESDSVFSHRARSRSPSSRNTFQHMERSPDTHGLVSSPPMVDFFRSSTVVKCSSSTCHLMDISATDRISTEMNL